MAKGRDPIQDFVQSKKRINDYFKCEGDFFLNPLMDLEWTIREEQDFYFLCYWTDVGRKIEAVVVKKNGEPMIYKTKDYTLVVAIDCVKIGFIFRNGKDTAKE